MWSTPRFCQRKPQILGCPSLELGASPTPSYSTFAFLSHPLLPNPFSALHTFSRTVQRSESNRSSSALWAIVFFSFPHSPSTRNTRAPHLRARSSFELQPTFLPFPLHTPTILYSALLLSSQLILLPNTHPGGLLPLRVFYRFPLLPIESTEFRSLPLFVHHYPSASTRVFRIFKLAAVYTHNVAP